tara:strand:+ start:133 stop:579 length:447 start_codon:yes stop_codon:yes gene_type:complete
MTRFNVAYTVSEDEYDDELVRLLKGTGDFLEAYNSLISSASSLIESDNHEGALKTIAQLRDELANADYRLHDVMNMIIQLLKFNDDKSKKPENVQVAQPEPTSKPVPAKEAPAKDMMEEVRDNIKSLGLQIPEEQLQQMLRKANDKAS